MVAARAITLALWMVGLKVDYSEMQTAYKVVEKKVV
jgi:hypothetical protein